MGNVKDTISFIGAGNVAFGLGYAFKDIADIAYVYSRSYNSAEKLTRRIGGHPTRELKDLANSDYIICAVDDDSLVDVANALDQIDFRLSRSIIMHTSGSVSVEVFSGISKNFGVFYPLQTFTYGRKVNMRSVPIFINAANQSALTKIRTLAKSISEKVVLMDDETRSKLHLPAVIINNFVNHLIYKGEEIAAELGLDNTLYHPLLKETVRKAIKNGPYNAQTGPAIRHDLSVIEKHKEALENHGDLLKIYNLITESIINTYHEDNR